jgi:chromosome segregation ATPase
MSKSIDTILKELIESQTAQTVALNEKLSTLAGDNNTYFERMKKMEDGLTEAMKKVLEMDASMKDYSKEMGKKIDEMEGKYSSLYQMPEKTPDNDDETKNVKVIIKKEEDSDKMEKVTKDALEDSGINDGRGKALEDSGIVDGRGKAGDFKKNNGMFQGPSEAKAEYEVSNTSSPARPDQEAKAEGEMGGNVIEGVNKEVVTGQPKDEEEDAPKMKRNRGGKNATGKNCQESNEAPKAETETEVKAEQTVSAPVASEESSIKATAEALNSKIEAVLQKLASVSQPKPEANSEVESTKAALALEVKAKEEAIAHMKALNEKFEALVAKVSTIEKSASTVEQKAAQIVASAGVDAVAVSIDQVAKSADQTDEEVFKQFEALKGPEQRKFYLANKSVIERHASSLLRAKRS